MLVTPIMTVDSEGGELGLALGRIYEVLGLEADMYRLLAHEDEARRPNGPFLYDAECFRVVDPAEPEFWVSELGDEGERYAYPEQWDGVGFFEDYHDGVRAVQKQFWSDLRQLYPRTYRERQGTS